jgi:hypothetical protein
MALNLYTSMMTGSGTNQGRHKAAFTNNSYIQ